jgi:hypothetical protein
VYAVEAVSNGRTVGFLPLALVSSMLFGRFLVSLPYLNTNGVVAPAADVQRAAFAETGATPLVGVAMLRARLRVLRGAASVETDAAGREATRPRIRARR